MFKYIPEREESKVERILWLSFWQQQTKFTITIIPAKPVSYLIQQKGGIPLFISSIGKSMDLSMLFIQIYV